MKRQGERVLLVSHGQTAYFSFDMPPYQKKNKRSGHARLVSYDGERVSYKLRYWYRDFSELSKVSDILKGYNYAQPVQSEMVVNSDCSIREFRTIS